MLISHSGLNFGYALDIPRRGIKIIDSWILPPEVLTVDLGYGLVLREISKLPR